MKCLVSCFSQHHISLTRLCSFFQVFFRFFSISPLVGFTIRLVGPESATTLAFWGIAELCILPFQSESKGWGLIPSSSIFAFSPAPASRLPVSQHNPRARMITDICIRNRLCPVNPPLNSSRAPWLPHRRRSQSSSSTVAARGAGKQEKNTRRQIYTRSAAGRQSKRPAELDSMAPGFGLTFSRLALSRRRRANSGISCWVPGCC